MAVHQDTLFGQFHAAVPALGQRKLHKSAARLSLPQLMSAAERQTTAAAPSRFDSPQPSSCLAADSPGASPQASAAAPPFLHFLSCDVSTPFAVSLADFCAPPDARLDGAATTAPRAERPKGKLSSAALS